MHAPSERDLFDINMAEGLFHLAKEIPATQKRISVDKWHRCLGELRSMSLALPGSRGLFSQMK